MELALERLRSIIYDNIEMPLKQSERDSLFNEFHELLGACYDAYEDRRYIKGELGIAETPDSFDQYRTRLLEHCKIALGIDDRGNQSADTICQWTHDDIFIIRGFVTKKN